MRLKRKSPGSHAGAINKKHSPKTTPRNSKAQASRVRVRLLFLVLPANGEDTLQPAGEHLLAVAHLSAGGFLLMFCQVRQKPGRKPYVRLPQKEIHDSSTPVAIPRDKTLIEGVELTILSAWEDAKAQRVVDNSVTYVVLSEPPFGESWGSAL